jgi:hypothetical protein
VAAEENGAVETHVVGQCLIFIRALAYSGVSLSTFNSWAVKLTRKPFSSAAVSTMSGFAESQHDG